MSLVLGLSVRTFYHFPNEQSLGELPCGTGITQALTRRKREWRVYFGIPGTDWIEGGVTVEESIELVRRLKAAGLDLLDVSHGFITPDISQVPWGPGFMIPTASRTRRESGIATVVGWMITDPEQAEEAIRDQHTDLVVLARAMLPDPYWPYDAAVKLGVENASEILPVQYARAVKR
ncbi:MAG: hypothetical protein ACLQIB_04575 [Isosphaeraceae bacterium]